VSARDRDYLDHILDAIERIQRYVGSSTEREFDANEMLQDAVIRNLEIIGEAATKLSAEFRAANTDIPWAQVAGMRNRLIHGYFAVDLGTVWATIEKDLPVLDAKLRSARGANH
jgi:uncharacterized protein with HEPN domain